MRTHTKILFVLLACWAAATAIEPAIAQVGGEFHEDFATDDYLDTNATTAFWWQAAGRTVAAGCYLYRITAGPFKDVRSMTLVK